MGYNHNFPKLKIPRAKSAPAKIPKKRKTKSKAQATTGVRRLNATNPFSNSYPQLGLNKAVRSCRACGNQARRLKSTTAFGGNYPNVMSNARQNMRTRVKPRTAFNWRYPNIGLHKLVGK